MKRTKGFAMIAAAAILSCAILSPAQGPVQAPVSQSADAVYSLMASQFEADNGQHVVMIPKESNPSGQGTIIISGIIQGHKFLKVTLFDNELALSFLDYDLDGLNFAALDGNGRSLTDVLSRGTPVFDNGTYAGIKDEESTSSEADLDPELLKTLRGAYLETLVFAKAYLASHSN